MKKLYPLWFAVLGLSLAVLALIIKRHVMFDSIANSSLSGLCSMISCALLIVGIHCLLFDSTPREFRLVPNLILFLFVSGTAMIHVIWQGLDGGNPVDKVVKNAAGNSLLFVMFYAVFLFLPRYRAKKNNE